MSDRILRSAAAVTLAGLVAFGAWAWCSVIDRTHGRWSPQAEVGGGIDHFADDTLFVSTSTRGVLPVVVRPETAITNVVVSDTVGAPGDDTVGELRPGRFVVARGHPEAPGGPLVAATILVYGPGQR